MKPVEAKNDLGPDMALYSNRMREIEETERLRKAHRQDTQKLSQAEKEEKAREMIARAEALAAERRDRTGLNKAESEEKTGGNFMKRLQSDAYLGSEMNLEERLNRNRHYRSRDAHHCD